MFKNRNLLYNIIILLIFSLIITIYIFYGLDTQDFLIIHDSATFNSLFDVKNKAFILQNNGFYGLGQSLFLATYQYLLMGIFYSLGYIIKLSPINITILFYFLIQTIILIFSYLGFYNIYRLYLTNFKDNPNLIYLHTTLVTIFYFFNTANIINISSGMFFSFSYLFYGFAPIFVYYLYKLINNTINNRGVVYLVLSSFFIVFMVTHIIPFIILSLILFIYNIKNIRWIRFTPNVILISLSIILVTLPITIPFLIQISGTNFIDNNLVNSTDKLIKGSFLYPMLSFFHWPLYTFWTPRSIYTFYSYYSSLLLNTLSLSMYGFIIYIFIAGKNIKDKLSPYIIILLVTLFFSKGSNSPFGELFLYLIKNIPIFGSIRSPDNKFSIIIPLIFSIIFIISIINYKKYRNYIRIYILILILFFSYPFFTKEAILSKDNYPESGSFVLKVEQEYKDVVNYLNNDPDLYKVLSLPQTGGFKIYDKNQKIFIGRDIISTLIRESIVSYDPTQDEVLKQFVLENKDINSLNYTNIKYILIRKDLFDKKEDIDKMFKLVETTESQKIIDNQYLTLYKVPEDIFKPKIIIDDDVPYSFNKINITQYEVSIKNLKNNTELNFLEGFDKQYKLYLNDYSNVERFNDTNFKYFTGRDLSVLVDKPVFEDSHKLVYDYANQWTIDPEYIKANFDKSYYKENPDGSIDIELTLYFKPQSYFYLGIIISGTTLILCLGYLGYAFYRKRGGKLSPHPALRASLASSQGGLKSEGQKGKGQKDSSKSSSGLTATSPKGGQNASERQIKGKKKNKSKSVIKIKK